MTEKPIREIGDKVGAKYATFFSEDLRKLHSAWVPKIQVDGRMMSISDESTESGCIESPNRYQALKTAREKRDSIRQRLADTLLRDKREE